MSPAAATQGADVYRAIADPTRRKILELLVAKPRSVGELCEPFAMSQPAISQHMRVLRDANLVSVRTEWRHRIYHVTPEKLRNVLEWVRHFEKFWDDALDRLASVVEDPGDRDV